MQYAIGKLGPSFLNLEKTKVNLITMHDFMAVFKIL